MSYQKYIEERIRFMRKTLLVGALLMSILTTSVDASAREWRLTILQKKNADRIARVVMDNYDKYKILPSLAVVQACNESSLGVYCRGNNLWGILSGAISYPSVEAGTHGYLRVVTNKKYYHGVIGETNYRTALRRILDGGYCEPEGAYYSNCMTLYSRYHFEKYDQQMWKEREEARKKEERRKKKEAEKRKKLKKEEKKRRDKQKRCYWPVYDPTVPIGTVVCSNKIFKKGTLNLIHNKKLVGIYDVTPTKMSEEEEYVLRINDPKYDEIYGYGVILDVHEEAVG